MAHPAIAWQDNLRILRILQKWHNVHLIPPDDDKKEVEEHI